ncbi:alpha/beta hydrolase [Reyranella sp.]|uniref:alpha/beta hydrolase n=1 Tax=Reyranella sp. TaxID=1929291 RepID=UPI003D10ED95
MRFDKREPVMRSGLRPIAAVAGFEVFHRNKFLNYQLNRWRALGDLAVADVREVARRTRDTASCAAAFAGLAQRLESENDPYRAAFCHRAVEFSTSPNDPEKDRRYRRFRELFYASEAGQQVEASWVPYGGGALAMLRVRMRTTRPRGQVVAFGGFDSCIEDFHLVWTLLAQAGYEVIAFDGPGQGAALRLRGQLFEHDRERPTAAVLDAVDARSVTLLGLSMGGYWAVRTCCRWEERPTRFSRPHPSPVRPRRWSGRDR